MRSRGTKRIIIGRIETNGSAGIGPFVLPEPLFEGKGAAGSRGAFSPPEPEDFASPAELEGILDLSLY